MSVLDARVFCSSAVTKLFFVSATITFTPCHFHVYFFMFLPVSSHFVGGFFNKLYNFFLFFFLKIILYFLKVHRFFFFGWVPQFRSGQRFLHISLWKGFNNHILSQKYSHFFCRKSKDVNPGIKPVPSLEPASWREIVQKRIESNTRRFARGRSKPEPEPKLNRFAAVAGQFFYPLMTKVDKSEPCLDLLGKDTTVLYRLLYTLAIVLYSSINIPVCIELFYIKDGDIVLINCISGRHEWNML